MPSFFLLHRLPLRSGEGNLHKLVSFSLDKPNMSPLVVRLLGILVFLGPSMGGPSASGEGVIADLAPSFEGMVVDPAPSDSCQVVVSDLSPCLSYLTEGSGLSILDEKAEPSESCCRGVKKIVSSAKTKPDKVHACNCIKAALSKVGSYNPDLIPTLPKKCGVDATLPPISPSYDCSKISFAGVVRSMKPMD